MYQRPNRARKQPVKAAPTGPMSLFNVHLADGNVTTVLAATSQAAYTQAVSNYPANARPLSTSIVPKPAMPPVPVWFVEQLKAEKAAKQRLDEEAAKAAAAFAAAAIRQERLVAEEMAFDAIEELMGASA